MYASLSNRLLATVIVCSLLLQSCRSGLRAITEEPVFKQEHPTPADHVQASEEVLLPVVLASSRTDARVRGVLGSMSPTKLVAVVLPASPRLFMGPFTASSGERVLLSQRQGQWQAVLQGGAGAMMRGRTLPVVSSGNIEASLKALQGQGAWSSRSRIHVLLAPHTPSTPCVYVGKLGLLGGAPKRRAQQQRGHEGKQAAEERAKLAEEKLTNLERQVLLPQTATPAMAFGVSEEWKKLQAAQAQQQREHEGKQAAEERTKLAEERAKLAEERARLAEERARLAEEKLTNLERQVLLPQTATPAMAFGVSEEWKKLQAAQAQQQRECEAKLVSAVQATAPEEEDMKPAARPPAQAPEEEDMKPAARPPAQVTGSSSVGRLPSLHALPLPVSTLIFGMKEWSQYFGEVGEEPCLPPDIGKILGGACPFWPGKTVKDTHLLVLIPARVAGKPFSLNLLEELIQCHKGGGYPTKYRNYGSDLQRRFATQSPRYSYWVLMTRDVLEGSRNETYASQQALVAHHAGRTGLPYELPGALEAATAILSHYVRSGERLYSDSPWTYTRCQELVSGLYPVVVGGFSYRGIDVSSSSSYDDDSYGVAGLWKFLETDTILTMAFGAKAWSQYFGEVGAEPSLPSDIDQILYSACPFWASKQVKDTHLLVLIPTTVNGKPFSLNLLGDLIQRPQGGGYPTKYRNYGDSIEEQSGTQWPRRSYWMLMTRDVLEGSRNKKYASQQALVAHHAGRTGLPYELPGALEAATAILSHHVRSGERLYTYDPGTYTRCRELVNGLYPAVVGGFSSGGITVDGINDYYYYFGGVAGLRKF